MINEKEKGESKYKIEYLGEKYSKELLTNKVIVLGLYGVGKEEIINKLLKRQIDNEYSPTISVDIVNFQVKVNDKIMQIQIWDACGNDEFALHTPNLFKNTSVALLVYDINDKNSFEALNNWYNMLLNNSYGHSIFLIGNKNNLEKERQVTKEEGEKFKNNYNAIKMFFETSSKDGENIDKLFDNMVISIYEKNEKDQKDLVNSKNNIKAIKLNKKDHKKRKKKKWNC